MSPETGNFVNENAVDLDARLEAVVNQWVSEVDRPWNLAPEIGNKAFFGPLEDGQLQRELADEIVSSNLAVRLDLGPGDFPNFHQAPGRAWEINGGLYHGGDGLTYFSPDGRLAFNVIRGPDGTWHTAGIQLNGEAVSSFGTSMTAFDTPLTATPIFKPGSAAWRSAANRMSDLGQTPMFREFPGTNGDYVFDPFAASNPLNDMFRRNASAVVYDNVPLVPILGPAPTPRAARVTPPFTAAGNALGDAAVDSNANATVDPAAPVVQPAGGGASGSNSSPAAGTSLDDRVSFLGAGFDPLENDFIGGVGVAYGTLLINPYGELRATPFGSAVTYPGAFSADGSVMLFPPGTSFGTPTSPFTCTAPDLAEGARVTCGGVTLDPPIFIAPGPFVVPTTNITRQPDGTVAYGGLDFGGLGTLGEQTGPFRPFPQPGGNGVLAGGGGDSAGETLVAVGGFGAGGIPPGPLSGWGESETFFGGPDSGTFTTDSSTASTGGFNINVLDYPQYLTTAFDVTGTRATGIQMMVVDTSEIFADGFESGDTSAWTDSPRQDGRLQQPASGPVAALRSAWGMLQRWVTPTAPVMSLTAHRTMAWPRGSSSRRIALSPVAGQTSGTQPEGDEPRLQTLITSLGVSTGEALTMRIVNVGPLPVELTGDGLVVQPLQDIAKEQLDRAIANLAAKNPLTMNVEAYCLEMLRLPPTVDTVFQVAGSELQKQFEPARRILGASRALFEAGQLSPDSDPLDYFHSIRQWAIWSEEQGFEEAAFAEAFVNHTKDNVAANNLEWTNEIEESVRQLTSNRFGDVQKVLTEAGLTARQAGMPPPERRRLASAKSGPAHSGLAPGSWLPILFLGGVVTLVAVRKGTQ